MFGWFKKKPPGPSSREVLAQVVTAVMGAQAARQALALHDDPQALSAYMDEQGEAADWEDDDRAPREGEVARAVFTAMLRAKGMLAVIDWAESGEELRTELQGLLAQGRLPPLTPQETAALAQASQGCARGEALDAVWPHWQAVAQARGRQAVRLPTEGDAHHVLLLTPEALLACESARFARGLPVL